MLKSLQRAGGRVEMGCGSPRRRKAPRNICSVSQDLPAFEITQGCETATWDLPWVWARAGEVWGGHKCRFSQGEQE